MQRVILAQWRSIDPNENRYRYYRIELTEDLWGDLCLVKTWGRIGRSTHRKVVWPQSQRELGHLLQESILERKRHGYHLN